MKKQKKQFTELSDEDLKQVIGGGYIQLIDFDESVLHSASKKTGPIDLELIPTITQQATEPCSANQNMYGEQICIPT